MNAPIVAAFWDALEIHHSVLYVVYYVEHQHKCKDHKSRMKKAHACLLAHCGFPSLGIQCGISVNAFSISLISLLYGIRKIFQAANHYHNRFIHPLLCSAPVVSAECCEGRGILQDHTRLYQCFCLHAVLLSLPFSVPCFSPNDKGYLTEKKHFVIVKQAGCYTKGRISSLVL